MNTTTKLRLLSSVLFCIAVAWGVFVIITNVSGWGRTGGILITVGGLVGIAANVYSNRHDRRRRQIGSQEGRGSTAPQ